MHILNGISVQNKPKPISFPRAKKPYHQIIAPHVTISLPRVKKLYHYIYTTSYIQWGTTYVAFGGLFSRNFEMILFALLLLNVT